MTVHTSVLVHEPPCPALTGSPARVRNPQLSTSCYLSYNLAPGPLLCPLMVTHTQPRSHRGLLREQSAIWGLNYTVSVLHISYSSHVASSNLHYVRIPAPPPSSTLVYTSTPHDLVRASISTLVAAAIYRISTNDFQPDGPMVSSQPPCTLATPTENDTAMSPSPCPCY